MSSVTPPLAASIFPNFIPELEDMIIANLSDDTKSLLNFSAVSRRAHAVVTNSFFSKEHFEQKYPDLAKSEKIYQVLRECYPTLCWKVMCCLQSTHPSRFSFKRDFLVQAVPSLRKSLQLQKENLLKELRDICGSGHADFVSSICHAEFDVMQNQLLLRNQQLLVLKKRLESHAIAKPLREAIP